MITEGTNKFQLKLLSDSLQCCFCLYGRIKKVYALVCDPGIKLFFLNNIPSSTTLHEQNLGDDDDYDDYVKRAAVFYQV